VREVDTPAVRRFVAQLAANGVSPGTIIGTRAVLRLVLGTAVEAGALTTNPCTGIKVPRRARPEMHFLTPEEVEDLAEAIAHPPLKPGGHGAAAHWRTDLPEFGLLVRLCAYTGLRAGELVARSRRTA
jgi:integrase